MTARVTIDASGLLCPLPVLKARKALKGLKTGDVLDVLATDPGAPGDFADFCAKTGCRMLESREAGGVFHFAIEKGAS